MLSLVTGLPAYQPVASLDAFKQSLTVADLLTMAVVTTAENGEANWARPVDFLFTHVTGALTR